MSVVASPCRDVCSLDQSGEYCIGCGRSLDEIARWQSATEAERRSIVAALPERVAAFDRALLRGRLKKSP